MFGGSDAGPHYAYGGYGAPAIYGGYSGYGAPAIFGGYSIYGAPANAIYGGYSGYGFSSPSYRSV